MHRSRLQGRLGWVVLFRLSRTNVPRVFLRDVNYNGVPLQPIPITYCQRGVVDVEVIGTQDHRNVVAPYNVSKWIAWGCTQLLHILVRLEELSKGEDLINSDFVEQDGLRSVAVKGPKGRQYSARTWTASQLECSLRPEKRHSLRRLALKSVTNQHQHFKACLNSIRRRPKLQQESVNVCVIVEGRVVALDHFLDALDFFGHIDCLLTLSNLIKTCEGSWCASVSTQYQVSFAVLVRHFSSLPLIPDDVQTDGEVLDKRDKEE